ncbi:Rv3235 family protein [Streptosporangium sandarakinum]|uniref:Rv3235 family protein n=1 Tax=Streptosporangium sandarakinum TaxID=1260955 RepID=UPI0033B5FFD0
MPLPRLAPHPPAEPPYDDERPPPSGPAAPPYAQGAPPYVQAASPYAQGAPPYVQAASPYAQGAPPYVQGALAPVGGPEPVSAREPEAAGVRKPEPVSAREPEAAGVREPGPAGVRDRRIPAWGPAGTVPDERRLRALGQAVAEALSGRRPPASLSAHMTVRAHAELVRTGKVMGGARPPLVGVPHVSRPGDGVVEMCVLVHCGDRPRVLALRLERRGTRWLCTDVETTP